MVLLKKKVVGWVMLALLASFPSVAVKNDLDLEGNGTLTTINLPFTYVKKQAGDTLTLIHQGGYKVYEIQQSQQEVVVIGPLRPCIAVVLTDGAKLVTFHKHSTNSLESMKEILKANLSSNKTSWSARIFTAKDDWEWNHNRRSLMHGGKSHTGAVKDIKDYLTEMGVKREQIPATLYPLRDTISSPLRYLDGQLGRYELAEVCVAVRLNDVFEAIPGETKQIKFFSIDPHEEDVFKYKGSRLTQSEMVNALTSAQRQQTKPTDLVIPYDAIPALAWQREGILDGYRYQRGICERRMNQNEEELYLKHFGKKSQHLIDEQRAIKNDGYGTLRFYPLEG
jgi:hypothetical protein